MTTSNFELPHKLKCILHIGTEKTGTSSVQQYLYDNQEINKKQGVLYLKLPITQEAGSQIEFAAAVADIDCLGEMSEIFSISNQATQENFKNDLQKYIYEQIRQEIEDNEITTIIISCEHFHSRLRSLAAVRRLKDFLDPFIEEYSIVMYVRRQVEMATSYYSTRIKTGQFDIPILPELDKESKSLSYYFNLNLIYDNWSKVFGCNKLLVSLYERESLYKKDIVQDLCQLVGITFYDLPKAINVNTSMNATGLEYMAYINVYLASLIRLFPVFTASLKVEIVNILSAKYNSKSYLITEQEAASFMKNFTLSNHALLIKIGSQNESLFGTDFSKYPSSLPVIKLNKLKALFFLVSASLTTIKLKIVNNTTLVHFVRKFPILKKMVSYFK